MIETSYFFRQHLNGITLADLNLFFFWGRRGGGSDSYPECIKKAPKWFESADVWTALS